MTVAKGEVLERCHIREITRHKKAHKQTLLYFEIKAQLKHIQMNKQLLTFSDMTENGTEKTDLE